MQDIHAIRLRLANEHRGRQIAEAAEHRVGRLTTSHRTSRPVRRVIGRSLVRLGSALANESEPTLQPARPR